MINKTYKVFDTPKPAKYMKSNGYGRVAGDCLVLGVFTNTNLYKIELSDKYNNKSTRYVAMSNVVLEGEAE